MTRTSLAWASFLSAGLLACDGQLELLTSEASSPGSSNAGASGAAGASGSAQGGQGGGSAGKGGSSGLAGNGGTSAESGSSGASGAGASGKGGQSGEGGAGASGASGKGGGSGAGGQGGSSGAGAGGSSGEGGSSGAGGSSGEGGSSGTAGSSGSGGASGASGASGQAGAAGSSTETTGCYWYDDMLTAGVALTGPGLFKPDGTVLPLTLPQQTDSATILGLDHVVAATDNHVFALGYTGHSSLALVALGVDPSTGDFSTIHFIDDYALLLDARSSSGLQQDQSYLYYTTPSGSGRAARRIDMANPVASEEFADFQPPQLTPFKIVPVQAGEYFMGATDRVVRIRTGKPPLSLPIAEGDYLGTFTVASSKLYYTIRHLANSSDPPEIANSGDLHIAQINEDGFTEVGTPTTLADPGAMISFSESGELPAVAVVTSEGIFKLQTFEDKLTQVFATAPTADSWPLLHYGRFGYGIHPTYGYGYYVYERCPSDNVLNYAPAFLGDSGVLQMRSTEAGFPFVKPALWPNQAPTARSVNGNKYGIYLAKK